MEARGGKDFGVGRRRVRQNQTDRWEHRTLAKQMRDTRSALRECCVGPCFALYLEHVTRTPELNTTAAINGE